MLADFPSVWQLVTSCNRMREWSYISNLQPTCMGENVCQSGVTQWHRDFCSWVNIVLNKSGHFAKFLTQSTEGISQNTCGSTSLKFHALLPQWNLHLCIGFSCHFVVQTIFCFCSCYFFLHSFYGGKWCHWVIKMTFIPIANSQLLLWFFEERAPFIVSFRTLVNRLIQLWGFQENCGVVFNATHTYQHIYFFLFS